MKKDIVLFDLDGTLANNDHRTHHLTTPPPDWQKFFAECDKDTPIEHIRLIFCAMAYAGYEIWIVSGRSDEVQDKTLEWLNEHGCAPHCIIMRKQGDYTPDEILKISWLNEGKIPKERVLCVFDDRQKVVDAWREAGLPCLQVAPGNF